MSSEFLRRLPLFAGLSDEDLDRLYALSEPLTIPAGQTLIEEGGPGDALYVVVDGEFEITKRSGSREVVIATRGKADFIGEMALLDNSPRSASVRALRESRVLKVSRAAFQELLCSSPAAMLAVLATVTARLRGTESVLMQHEKMASLGTLAAGLAHELNNPAAAVKRSTVHLHETLAEWRRLTAELGSLPFDRRQAEALVGLQAEMERRAASRPALDPLFRCDCELDLQDWLEDRGVDRAWELGPTLVDLGWDVQALAEFTDSFSDSQLAVIVPWLASGAAAVQLLDEIRMSADQISQIVKAVKTYSYLDQAPIQEVDVHEGLENTLVILRHKLKGGVQVTREYDPDLPRIEAYAGELNQVWTNLIDNAIDAMEGQGTLTLRTYAQEGHVVVEISDTGPGIPPEVQARMFDPFFTTKPQGIGTGLGLHIVYNIVVDKHRGRINVVSEPGATTFQITLPLNLSWEPSAARPTKD